MENIEPNPANFGNQERFPVVKQGHQISYKTFKYHLSCLQELLVQWFRACESGQ